MGSVQVSFFYNSYGIDKKYHHRRDHRDIINPNELIMANGRYYLVANNNKYEDYGYYRLDRISEIELLDSKNMWSEKSGTGDYKTPSSVAYANSIYMFSGETGHCTFKVKKSYIGEVIDWFGKKINIQDSDNEYCVVTTKVNYQAMKRWALQYMEAVTVLSPESLCKDILEMIQIGEKQYQKDPRT